MVFYKLQDSPTLNNINQHRYYCYHQQNVNNPPHRVTGHKSQKPQNYQYCSNVPQHTTLLLTYFRFDPGCRNIGYWSYALWLLNELFEAEAQRSLRCEVVSFYALAVRRRLSQEGSPLDALQ